MSVGKSVEKPDQEPVISLEKICASPDLLRDFLAGINYVADGNDAGGKSSATKAVKEWLVNHGLQVYNLIEFQRKTNRTWPDSRDFPVQSVAEKSKIVWIDMLSNSYDALILGEPAWAGGGWDLRMGTLQHLDAFSPRELVEGFSAYRSPLYGLVIVPWLEEGGPQGKGGIILKERDLSTSIIYQPIFYQIDKEDGHEVECVDINFVISREGNKRALAAPPSALFIMTCSAEEAVRRITHQRLDKKDNCAFETPKYLPRVVEAYRSDQLDTFFTPRGTYVAHIDTTGWQVQDTMNAVTHQWELFLKARWTAKYGAPVPCSAEKLVEEATPLACGD